MNITILDDYQDAVKNLSCFGLLRDHQVQILHHTEKNENRLVELLQDTDILVLIRERTHIHESLLARLPKLKLISQTGKISHHLDLAACTRHLVAVAEGIGSPIAPAELTWALIMNSIRQIPQAIEDMKNGKWQQNIGRTVYGQTIGIWGYGKIGQKIAQYAQVFGANVVIWGSETSRQRAIDDGFQQANSKEEFFMRCDIISLHLRLNEKTEGIVKESDLMSMKENAIFINTARAELIEKAGLENVLRRGKKLFVGLDVYETEPIFSNEFDLMHMKHVICTPHIGYVEHQGYEMYFGKAFENIVHFINGSPTHIANPEVLKTT
jgi:D-3-phosphoglycerate dehydrogenase